MLSNHLAVFPVEHSQDERGARLGSRRNPGGKTPLKLTGAPSLRAEIASLSVTTLMYARPEIGLRVSPLSIALRGFVALVIN